MGRGVFRLKHEKYMFNFIDPGETRVILAEWRYVQAPRYIYFGTPNLFDGRSYWITWRIVFIFVTSMFRILLNCISHHVIHCLLDYLITFEATWPRSITVLTPLRIEATSPIWSLPEPFPFVTLKLQRKTPIAEPIDIAPERRIRYTGWKITDQGLRKERGRSQYHGPMWKMHFSEIVETALLETVEDADGDLLGLWQKAKHFKVPKWMREKGVTESDIEDVGNVVTRMRLMGYMGICKVYSIQMHWVAFYLVSKKCCIWSRAAGFCAPHIITRKKS